ncbi:MAG: 50S ribosomal protein L16 [Oligoflexales bacterium]|nr:50S ribosomal protein L16 [Oligoflexales bacterium]
MLAPKKFKFRKSHKPKFKGIAQRGSELSFGQFGLMVVQSGRISARQIEAARIAMTRHIKRGGQIWIKMFPHTPVSRKPAEVRMGKGKGSVDHYVAVVKAGRIIYEMKDVEPALAKQALSLAASKLPLRTKLIIKGEDPWVI